MTHGNCLSLFLPVLSFYEIYYPINQLTPHSTLRNKRDLKHYERGVSRHLFSAHLVPRLTPRQRLSEFITEDQRTGTFHVFMTFLIVLPTPSLAIEVVKYCTTERAKLYISILDCSLGSSVCSGRPAFEQNCGLGSCVCSEGPALGHNTLMMMMVLKYATN